MTAWHCTAWQLLLCCPQARASRLASAWRLQPPSGKTVCAVVWQSAATFLLGLLTAVGTFQNKAAENPCREMPELGCSPARQPVADTVTQSAKAAVHS